MIGLDNVKELVYEIYAMLQISQYRADAGLSSKSHVYHMIFKGNPGTGKTTVARLIAKLFHRMGVWSKGHFIEVERADLVKRRNKREDQSISYSCCFFREGKTSGL